MKKLLRILITVIMIVLLTAMLSGCKAKKDDVSILVNEGDIEIVVPDDQEIGGE